MLKKIKSWFKKPIVKVESPTRVWLVTVDGNSLIVNYYADDDAPEGMLLLEVIKAPQEFFDPKHKLLTGYFHNVASAINEVTEYYGGREIYVWETTGGKMVPVEGHSEFNLAKSKEYMS